MDISFIFGIFLMASLGLAYVAWRSYGWALVIYCGAVSNIFLINSILGYKSGGEDNVFGLRDSFFLVLLVIGVLKKTPPIKLVLSDYVLRSCLYLFLLSLVSLSLGYMRGADLVPTLKDFAVLAMWLFVPILVANLRTLKEISFVFRALLTLTILVGIGTIIEVASFGRIAIVSKFIAGNNIGSIPRVFPDAAILFAVGVVTSLYMLFCARADLSRSKMFFYSAVGLSSITASIFSGMRTHLAAGTLVAFIVIIFRIYSKRLPLFLVIAGMITVLGITSVQLGRAVAGDSWAASSIGRFEQLFSSKYLDDMAGVESDDESLDGRLREVRAGIDSLQESPVIGLGAGVPYRSYIQFLGDTRTSAHNIYLWFMVKGGMLAVSIFLYYQFGVFRTAMGAVRGNDEASILASCTALSLLAMSVSAIFGNVFGSPQTLPFALILTAIMVRSKWIGATHRNPNSRAIVTLADGQRFVVHSGSSNRLASHWRNVQVASTEEKL